MKPGWRLEPAAAVLAVAEDRVWMTVEQFAAWWTSKTTGPMRHRIDPVAEVGISREMARARIAGRQRVRKIEALAIAHHALAFPIPIPVHDTRAFNDWFHPRFGLREYVNEWLDLNPGTLGLYLQGYTVKQGKRWDRLADPCLIRALDWVHRVGPVCPWTPPLQRVFAEQEIAQ